VRIGKYVNIQMKREVHQELKEYANKNGYTISGLVERLVKKELNHKPTVDPNKVLKSNPIMKKYYN